jgi:hypothetical protein
LREADGGWKVARNLCSSRAGTQPVAEIRAWWPELPVVIATGYPELPKGSNLDLPRLNKPYGQEELAAMIARLMPARAAPTP